MRRMKSSLKRLPSNTVRDIVNIVSSSAELTIATVYLQRAFRVHSGVSSEWWTLLLGWYAEPAGGHTSHHFCEIDYTGWGLSNEWRINCVYWSTRHCMTWHRHICHLSELCRPAARTIQPGRSYALRCKHICKSHAQGRCLAIARSLSRDRWRGTIFRPTCAPLTTSSSSNPN